MWSIPSSQSMRIYYLKLFSDKYLISQPWQEINIFSIMYDDRKMLSVHLISSVDDTHWPWREFWRVHATRNWKVPPAPLLAPKLPSAFHILHPSEWISWDLETWSSRFRSCFKKACVANCHHSWCNAFPNPWCHASPTNCRRCKEHCPHSCDAIPNSSCEEHCPHSCDAIRNSQSDNGKTKAENPTKGGLKSLKVTQALADWSSPTHLSSRASSGCLWTMSCWGERLTPLGSEGYGLERGEPDGDSVPKESFLTESLSGTSTDENWRWEIEEDFRFFMTYDHEDLKL